MFTELENMLPFLFDCKKKLTIYKDEKKFEKHIIIATFIDCKL